MSKQSKTKNVGSAEEAVKLSKEIGGANEPRGPQFVPSGGNEGMESVYTSDTIPTGGGYSRTTKNDEILDIKQTNPSESHFLPGDEHLGERFKASKDLASGGGGYVQTSEGIIGSAMGGPGKGFQKEQIGTSGIQRDDVERNQ
ncbi:hypothetical protein QYM36_007448 [Artemia franciscana]|uniref:Uncharacterized protein n=1 Tax=Artemia franciscana TaxID=6661 RepID=A0AA88I9A4_ARTSF|nr:hypothetical protein QYM36_007448 [Artemia franciscana]